ncbi:hypothetical protein HYC85_010310 [Camellia sinensis]|uniref:F-box domain-containing protein n=1 Tax=Camellia sinensis TaxID=4442 RepID=A0A7J7HKA9_CAMSI|nr:hypothetical protein HYC85_010310 [Camellia sinensis]
MRFKSVSKHWLSLITNPYFVHCRNPNSSSVSGLFLYSSMRHRDAELNFIPLQNNEILSDDNDYVYLTPLTTIPSLSAIPTLKEATINFAIIFSILPPSNSTRFLNPVMAIKV